MPHPGWQQRLDGWRDGGAIDDVLDPGERGRAAHRLLPPSRLTASASLARSRAAVVSPSRWLQLIPAACRNVASPRICGAPLRCAGLCHSALDAFEQTQVRQCR